MSGLGLLIWTFSFPREVGSVISVLRLGRVPCKEPVCLFLQRGHCMQPSHLNLERGKAHFIAPEMQRWSSSCCMSIITSLQVPSSRNTLLQTHCKAGGGGGLSQLGTGGQSHPDLQGQPALWWGHSSRPRHNYCRLHKQLWGIRMTNVRQPFKSRFWKIFLLQENAHVVGMKRKKKKGSKSKPAETITRVHLRAQLGLSSFTLRLMSANYQRENKKRRSYS